MSIFSRIVSAVVLATTCSYAVYNGKELFLWYLCLICIWSAIECVQLLQSAAGYIILILITVFPTCIYYLRQQGTNFVIRLFFITWFSDSFAYISGNFFGGAKIWSEISPKKTISGTVGGVLAGTIIGLFMNASLMESLFISLSSQVGDMIESYAKRKAFVKDSDIIFYIPGHGGILDRIDGLLLATPVAVIFKIFF